MIGELLCLTYQLWFGVHGRLSVIGGIVLNDYMYLPWCTMYMTYWLWLGKCCSLRWKVLCRTNAWGTVVHDYLSVMGTLLFMDWDTITLSTCLWLWYFCTRVQPFLNNGRILRPLDAKVHHFYWVSVTLCFITFYLQDIMSLTLILILW